MKINATEIRVGMILEYKNDLWEVLKTNHVKPGKGCICTGGNEKFK